MYLAVLIGEITNRISSWKLVIDKFLHRLSKWKAKSLSIGGRLTLLKFMLGSLAIYYTVIFRVPETVLKILERIQINFFGVLILVNASCFGLVGIKFWLVKIMDVLGLVVSSPSTVLLFSNGGGDFFC